MQSCNTNGESDRLSSMLNKTITKKMSHTAYNRKKEIGESQVRGLPFDIQGVLFHYQDLLFLNSPSSKDFFFGTFAYKDFFLLLLHYVGIGKTIGWDIFLNFQLSQDIILNKVLARIFFANINIPPSPDIK